MNYIQRIYDLLTEAQINERGNPDLKTTKTGLTPGTQAHAVKLQRSGGHEKAQKWVHKAASKQGTSMRPQNPTSAQRARIPGSGPQNKNAKPPSK